MRVRITAHSIIQVPFLFCAGRAFPVGSAREIEVLEQEDDPPPVTVEVRNHTTGQMQKEERPDPDRMGRKSYKLIQEDQRLSFQEGASVDAAIAGAEVAAARAEVARVSALHLDAQTENAALKAQIADLQAQLAASTEKKGKKTAAE